MKKFILFFSALFFSLYTISQVVSDFEGGDTDNWHSEGDGDYYWEATTGNPGACFRVDDDATGDWNNAFAPVKFLGNWSTASSTDYVSADIFLHPIATTYGSGIFVFQIKGPGGIAKAFIGSQPAFDTWTTYTAYLDPSNWTMESGDWNLLLEQVTELIVRAEYIQGDEYVRIDNVVLSITPVIIPIEPVICSDFEAVGYDGWSFNSTGGVSNNTTGGNPGRCLKISDGSGISSAYPPPKFLGDWTLIDNHNADIRMDIKITNYSGDLLSNGYFMKISGPGGEATISLTDLISKSYDRYKTFVFPIEESSWTMVSGTWGDLMNHVNSFEIIIEFLDATEIVWFDNFCISDLPPVADFDAFNYIEFIGNPIRFNDLSVQGPTTWSWDFGDGNTSTDQHPENNFLTNGTYDVSLTANNHFGSDNMIKTGYIEILPIDQCLKHEDDFNDNSVSPLWKTKNGTWSEASGNIRQTSNHYVTNDLLSGCFAITGSPAWEDYILSCDIRSTDNDNIGLVWNWQDEFNMYMFNWNLQSSYRRISKYVDGVETILAEDNIGYTTSTWYQIDVFAIDGKHILIIDGVEIFAIDDNAFTNGKAGLFCSGNQSSYWDNFKVECPGTPVDLTAFLEGPYNGMDMNNKLLLNNYLATTNPYNSSPWNYSNNEGVLTFSNPDVVDWVLVDFRDATSAFNATPATSVETKAGLLLSNGQIISPYGGQPIYHNKEINNNLFISIIHRNHLGILSANPVVESGGTFTYNFTSGSVQAFGNDAQKNLGGGVYGLYAGDADANGTINEDDKNTIWMSEAGLSGYLQNDLDLDGQGDNIDKNDVWLNNNGESSQVPN